METRKQLRRATTNVDNDDDRRHQPQSVPFEGQNGRMDGWGAPPVDRIKSIINGRRGACHLAPPSWSSSSLFVTYPNVKDSADRRSILLATIVKNWGDQVDALRVRNCRH
uniref:Uncharacterized protein n=1 Tax=Panagrellus redivivus TaxID=6233 RepID=A0A7E4VHL7_PANRE